MRINKNIFIKLASFREHECFAMAKYLEEKALQGWMLNDILCGFLIFKKTTPKKCSFTVDIFSNINKKEYIEYCEAGGWKHLCGTSRYNIFYSENKDTTAIQTDEEMVLKQVRKYLLKGILSSFLLIPLIILNLYTMQNTAYTFVRDISSNSFLFLALQLLIVIICRIITTLDDIIWYFKSSQSLKLGHSLNYPSLDSLKMKMIASDFYICLAGLMIISLINNIAFNKLYLYLAMFTVLFTFFINKFLSIIIKRNNKIISLGVCIVSICIATYSIFIGSEIENNENANNREPLMEIGDFLNIKTNNNYLYIENYSSIISSYYSYSYEQDNTYINEVSAIERESYEDNSYSFNYEILKSKHNWALDRSWNSYLDTYKQYEYYEAKNDWDALEVYKSNSDDGGYLLRYEDRIVLVSGNVEFTKEDINFIKDKCNNW